MPVIAPASEPKARFKPALVIEHKPSMALVLERCGWNVRAIHPTALLSPLMSTLLQYITQFRVSLVWVVLPEAYLFGKNRHIRAYALIQECLIAAIRANIPAALIMLAGPAVERHRPVLTQAGVDMEVYFIRLCALEVFGERVTATPQIEEPPITCFVMFSSVRGAKHRNCRHRKAQYMLEDGLIQH